jgi:hypothetical protein
MEVQRKIDATARVVTLTVTGELGDSDLPTLGDHLAQGSDLDVDYSLLIDLRQAHGQSVTSAGVYRLLEQPLVLSPSSRRAVVVASDLGFGMTRMYEMLRKERGGAPHVFRDFDQAWRWVTSGRR